MEPENDSFQKESSFPVADFQVPHAKPLPSAEISTVHLPRDGPRADCHKRSYGAPLNCPILGNWGYNPYKWS